MGFRQGLRVDGSALGEEEQGAIQTVLHKGTKQTGETPPVLIPIPTQETELKLPHAPAHHGHLRQLRFEDDLQLTL